MKQGIFRARGQRGAGARSWMWDVVWAACIPAACRGSGEGPGIICRALGCWGSCMDPCNGTTARCLQLHVRSKAVCSGPVCSHRTILAWGCKMVEVNVEGTEPPSALLDRSRRLHHTTHTHTSPPAGWQGADAAHSRHRMGLVAGSELPAVM